MTVFISRVWFVTVGVEVNTTVGVIVVTVAVGVTDIVVGVFFGLGLVGVLVGLPVFPHAVIIVIKATILNNAASRAIRFGFVDKTLLLFRVDYRNTMLRR